MRFENIIESIGRTPLIRIQSFADENTATIWGKLESNNPMASVKDRIARQMVLDAEDRGEIQPGKTTLVEPTSGNTGIGLAMVSASRGYDLILTMPETMSTERRKILQALGAELVLTPGDKGMKGAEQKAQEITDAKEDHVMLQQFKNMSNRKAHRETTALEILEDMEGLSFDAFVAGVGTGGTISGVGEVIRGKNYPTRIIAVEPADSPVISGGSPGPHRIQGIGAGFIPEVLDRDVIDRVITVTNEDAFATSRLLAAKEGFFVGISAGANVWAAAEIARELGAGKHVVTVLCDTGERYLSTDLFDMKQ